MNQYTSGRAELDTFFKNLKFEEEESLTPSGIQPKKNIFLFDDLPGYKNFNVKIERIFNEKNRIILKVKDSDYSKSTIKPTKKYNQLMN